MIHFLLFITAVIIDLSLFHSSGDVPGISVILWQSILVYCILLVRRSKFQNAGKKKIPSTMFYFIGITFILSIWFSIFTNPFFSITFLVIIFIINSILIFLVYNPEISFEFNLIKDSSIFGYIVHSFIKHGEITFSDTRDIFYKNDYIRTYTPLFLRAFYALALLLFLIVPLLLSADEVFRTLISNFFLSLFADISFLDLVERIFSIFCITWILFTLFFSLQKSEYTPNDREILMVKIHKVYNYIILGALNIIYFLFIVIQFRYTWFVDSMNFSNLGISYGEYVHEGFYQLILVAGINYILYLYFYRKTHIKGEKITKGNLSILLLLTLLLTYSALSRALLYIQVYHMTELRFFVVYITICIAILLLLSFVHLYIEKMRVGGFFLQILLISFIGIGYFNIDKFIAQYNIDHSDATSLDTEYLLSLSDDALIEKKPYMFIDKSDKGDSGTRWIHYNYYSSLRRSAIFSDNDPQ